jgi:MFS family permease
VTAPGRHYLAYLLFLLCATNAMNFGDRILFGVVQELIRAEFRLNDFYIGLLGGPAFALLYTVMGLPIARLAERRDRVTMLSIALAGWSFMTLCGGLAANYWQLFLSRMGISLGEAGCAPPAHSLISDHFPPERRASAFSIYAVGAPLGSLLMATAGGAIAQVYGWRTAFIVAGAVGIVLALIMVMTLRDPRRVTGAPQQRASFIQTVRYLFSKRSFVQTCLGGGAAGFGGVFILLYLVSFLIRSHGMSIASAAAVVGLVGGVASALGQWISGMLADRLGRTDRRAIVLIPAVGLSLSAICYFTAFTVAWLPFVVSALVLAAALQNSYMGQSFAVAQTLAPPHMRATAAAVFLFFSSLFGSGLGPPILGATSDMLARRIMPVPIDPARCTLGIDSSVCAIAVAEGLRIALLIAAATLIWSAIHYWLAARYYVKDVDAGYPQTA